MFAPGGRLGKCSVSLETTDILSSSNIPACTNESSIAPAMLSKSPRCLPPMAIDTSALASGSGGRDWLSSSAIASSFQSRYLVGRCTPPRPNLGLALGVMFPVNWYINSVPPFPNVVSNHLPCAYSSRDDIRVSSPNTAKLQAGAL
jgi:hypothetical protein